MKRKLKIKNLIKDDVLYIAGKDWISTAMGINKYKNELVLTNIDDPTNFEIEIEVNERDKDIMIRVTQQFYISIELIVKLKKYITIIKLNRIADHIY